MSTFPIVGKRFSPEEFAVYAAHVPLTAFVPSMVVLHNTAVPTLAQRPQGFTAANMVDLEHYYAEVQKWNGGPHLFIDQNGIWVFNPLDRRGTHSPSWNGIAWGVEMLGDFATESFTTGPGLSVHAHAIDAVAALFARLGAHPNAQTFRLHKEDPKTTHVCPGKNVDKAAFMAAVIAAMEQEEYGTKPLPVKVVVYRRGYGASPAAVLDGELSAGVTTVEASAWNAANLGLTVKGVGKIPLRQTAWDLYSITFDSKTGKVFMVER